MPSLAYIPLRGKFIRDIGIQALVLGSISIQFHWDSVCEFGLVF